MTFLFHSQVASRPESQNVKCLFRLTFIPKDVYDLLQTDNVAFDYFFTQVCSLFFYIILSGQQWYYHNVLV